MLILLHILCTRFSYYISAKNAPKIDSFVPAETGYKNGQKHQEIKTTIFLRFFLPFRQQMCWNLLHTIQAYRV